MRARPASRPLPDGIPLAFSIPEIARALSVSETTIYQDVRAGKLPVHLLGEGPRKKRVVTEPDLRAYLASRRQSS